MGAIGHDGLAVPGKVDLAHEPPFTLGSITIHPGTRQVVGVDSQQSVEPRVMQVLVALVRAKGAIVTRDELTAWCWDGRIVGEDAINRTLSRIRQIAAGIGEQSFRVETIAKVGYRLIVDGADATTSLPTPAALPDGTEPSAGINRRQWGVGAVAAGVAALGGIAGWNLFGRRPDPHAVELVARGAQILRDEMPDSNQQGIGFLVEATKIDPDNSDAWGLLALAWRNAAEHSPPSQTASAVASCEAAARRALALDPNQGNALSALAKLRPIFGDWLGAERRFKAVLAIAPDNSATISALGTLLQSVGRVSESSIHSARAAEIDPLSPIYQFRRTYGLWCTGRLGEADRTIDRALQLWPRHPAVWSTRALIYALTDRPRAALAMINDREGRPFGMSERAVDFWRGPLKALETGASADVAAAMISSLAVVARSPGTAVSGICFASKLGDLDSAFAMADAYLLRRGPLVGGLLRSGPDQLAVTDQRWRMTMMLFIPATAQMRADARFLTLCREMGMADYWRARGTRPDFLLQRS
ncbi:MAG: winged helix-turn-helix domain-containing protein [Sphingomicrobium sp.]